MATEVEHDWKEENKLWDYKSNVFEGILYYATEEGPKPLPTEVKYVHLSICHGVQEFVRGKEVEWRTAREIGKSPGGWRAEVEMWKSMEKELEKTKKLHPKVKDAVEYLLHANVSHDLMGEPGVDCGLDIFFGPGRGIDVNYFSSTSTLGYGTVDRIKKEVIPSFAEDELKDVKGIGTATARYMAKYVENVRKTHYW